MTVSDGTLQLTPQVISSFRTSKLFRSHVASLKHYTSSSFDDKGEYVITSAQDDTLQLFNCRTGKHKASYPSHKYGAHLARFTHASSAVIYASTKENDAIRHMSTHDLTYLRYYKGHTAQVTSLELSPVDDVFISAAKDDTVRLWDLRSPNCQGYLGIAGHPTVSWDPTGAVFAVTLNHKGSVLMYDIRNFDKAPFLSENINDPILNRIAFPPKLPVYTSSKFSNDGKWILVGTSGRTHYILDSFNCSLVARLEGHEGLEMSGLPLGTVLTQARAGLSGEECCWTPDSRYVLSGSDNGMVHVWDVNPPQDGSAQQPAKGPECTLRPIASIPSETTSPTRVVNFNPKTGMFVSGGIELAFWLPTQLQ